MIRKSAEKRIHDIMNRMLTLDRSKAVQKKKDKAMKLSKDKALHLREDKRNG